MFHTVDGNGMQFFVLIPVCNGSHHVTGSDIQTEYIFVVELNGLNGRERLEKIAPVYSIAHV